MALIPRHRDAMTRAQSGREGRGPPPAAGSPPPPPAARHADALLLDGVRRGEEAAFAALVDRHGEAMLRFAMLYTPDAALAEDAVQDAWVGVLRGLDRFQGRCSLRTWLFGILLNRLKTRLKRERRCMPFSACFDAEAAPAEPAVERERFLDADHPRWPHHWRTAPASWGESPEDLLLARETREVVERAVAALPPAQREVVTLRDVEEWSSEEVRELLQISEVNQRVLLHRARSKVRRALEDYFAQG